MADGRFEEGLSGLEAGASATARQSGTPAGEEAAESHPSVTALRGRFSDAVLHHAVMAGDEHVVYIAADRALDVFSFLKEDADQAYDYLADVTAVDFGGGRPLEVVYQLWSMSHKRALRVKITLPLSALAVDSVTALWHTADWLEREAFDMFGIQFRGHPDLRRILMPEKYAEGHPLRKDFPLRGRFSRAEQTRRALAMSVEDYYIPEELRIAAAEELEPPEGAGAPADLSATEPGAADAAGAAARRPKKAGHWSLGTTGEGGSGAPAPGE